MATTTATTTGKEEEEEEGEMEREAWEAQVDESVALVSILGEERAALLARGRRTRRKRAGGGGGGGDDDDGDDDFAAVDVGDDDEVALLREAGFRAAGPLQLRLLVEAEILTRGDDDKDDDDDDDDESGDGNSGGGGGGSGGGGIRLTIGGGDAAASVSLLQPLRLAVALPRGYLMPQQQQQQQKQKQKKQEGEKGDKEEGDEDHDQDQQEESSFAPAVSVSAPWLSPRAAARLERRVALLSSELLLQGEGSEAPLPLVSELVEFLAGSAVEEALCGCGGGGTRGRSLDLLEVVGGGGGENDINDENQNDGENDENDDDDDSLASSALALLRQLLSDDAALERERFLRRNDHSCPICLEEGIAGNLVTQLVCCASREARRRRRKKNENDVDENGVEASSSLPSRSSSSRAACNGCLRALCESALSSKDPSSLLCPYPDCREPLPPATLATLLGNEAADAAEELRLESALRSLGCRRCPHCGFRGVVADEQGCCLCPRPQCRFAFCAECFDSWHAGGAAACSDPEARLMLARARASGSSGGGGGGDRNTRESARALRKAEEEFLSLSLISRSGFKACPACKTPIERTSGCNRMRCAACSTVFCFCCSSVIPEVEGYSHFGAGRCRLLSDAEVARLRDEEMMATAAAAANGGGGAAAAAAFAAAAAAADRNAFWLGVAREQQQQQQLRRQSNNSNDGGGGEGATSLNKTRQIRVSRCPHCRARHASESNDRRCCNRRHCGCCGEEIRRGVMHFGKPPKCPAHF